MRLNDGAAYDPETDAWWPLALPDGLPARSCHVAVWTGEWMIAWGGYSSWPGGVRYDPAADRWENVEPDGAPNREWMPKAFWTGTEMIAWAELSSARYTP